MRIVELEIKNWEKHNPRSDIKTARWFKMSNEFFNDPEFYGITLEARVVWMFLLCTASKQMSANIKVNTQMIADLIQTRVESVDFAINILERSGSIFVKPATLVSDNLQSVRKDKVTIEVRALEERREEERREEKNINNAEKNLSKNKPQEKPKGAIEVLKTSPLLENLLLTVPQSTQETWMLVYGKETLERELSSIIIWLASNPTKQKKDLSRFIGNWLNNSKIRSPYPSNMAHKSFSKKTNGLTPTAENPTGNPYLQEEINKGIA